MNLLRGWSGGFVKPRVNTTHCSPHISFAGVILHDLLTLFQSIKSVGLLRFLKICHEKENNVTDVSITIL